MGETIAENVKWEGNFKKEVKGFTADQIWGFFEDYLSLHKVFPHIYSCEATKGEIGKPGLVRHLICSPAFLPPSADPQPDTTYFIDEELLTIDSTKRTLSYQIVDNNVGINTDYVGTYTVVPLKNEQGEEDGCLVGWSVAVEPLKGRTYEDFQSGWSALFNSTVQNIVAQLTEPHSAKN